MKLNFKNKIVLITGGEGGLGRSICNKFLKLGAKVIVTTTKKELINQIEVYKEVSKGNNNFRIIYDKNKWEWIDTPELPFVDVEMNE